LGEIYGFQVCFLVPTGTEPPPPPEKFPNTPLGGYPYDPAVNVSLVSVNRSVARTGGSLKVQVSV